MDPQLGSKGKKQSKLLVTAVFDVRNEQEEKMENAFSMVYNRINGLNERESHDALIQLTSESKVMHETAIAGLLYGLMVEPQNAQKYFSLLALAANDAWYCALCNVNMIVIELYPKLRPEAREQIWFFFREAIRANVPKIDNVLNNLIRTLNDGLELKDIRATLSAVTSLLNSNYPWLSSLRQKASLIPVSLQTFSRFICDLNAYPQCDGLRKEMIAVCDWLLRERFLDCAQLGRDLILVIMRISKIPQFAAIWRQLCFEPAKLAPGFCGVEELMSRSFANFQTYRVSVAMQRKMEFILKLKPPSHEKHVDWFRKQHLSSSDAGNLRAEAIRCALFIPLGPDTPPTAAEMKVFFITSLLSGAPAGVEQQWCKLQLFWDWFCFDPSISGAHLAVEPGFCVIKHLLHNQHLLANSLLDFLVRMSVELWPSMQARIVSSVVNAFKAVADHNINLSISSVLENSFVPKNLRDTLRETFKGLVRSSPPQVQTASFTEKVEPSTSALIDADLELTEVESRPSTADGTESITFTNGNALSAFEEETNDEEEEEQESCMEEVTTLLPAVKEEFRDAIENLAQATNTDVDMSEMMQKLLSNVLENEDLLDEEQTNLLAECLLVIFGKRLRPKKLFPPRFAQSQEFLSEVFSHPIYVIFRNLCLTPESDATRQPLLSIIAEIYEKCSSVSYLLLFFLCSGLNDQNVNYMSAYTNLCRVLERTVIEQLIKDLEQCHVDDYVLFGHLVPFVYAKFPSEAMNSPELMKLIADSVDGRQIADIVGEMIEENISFFKKDSFASIVTASYSWDTLSKLIFWQLVHAENVPIEWMMPLLAKIQLSENAEAATNVYIMLQRMDREPTMNLIRVLLSRRPPDLFTVKCLRILIREQSSALRVAEHLGNLIDKLIQSGDITATNVKQRRGMPRYVCLEHVFAHLDYFRQTCLSDSVKKERKDAAESFLMLAPLQNAFYLARGTEKISDLKTRFSELFAVIEILSDEPGQGSRTRRSKLQKRPVDTNEDDSKSKKRKTVIYSDSD